MRWIKRRSKKVDPDALMIKAEMSLKTTTGNQERINALTAYLESRKDQNHFGDEFEITLLPKGG